MEIPSPPGITAATTLAPGTAEAAAAATGQAFAVSPRRPVSDAKRLRLLAAAREDAWRCWWRLFTSPCLAEDPRMWRDMVRARLAYQDATIACLEAAREENSDRR